MKHTILITGAGGFIGKRVIKLLENKYKIVEVDIKSKNNITNPGLMDKIFKENKPDYVIHLAPVLTIKFGII